MSAMSIAGLYLIQAMELVVFTVCAVALVFQIPLEVDSARWKRIGAWCVYAALSIFLPNYFHSDYITIPVLALTYVLIGRFFYFKNKMGYVCQIVFCAVMLATQYMAVFVVGFVQVAIRPETFTIVALVSVFKSLFLIMGTLPLCWIVRKRLAHVEYLKIGGMVIVPVFSMLLMFLYLVSSEFFMIRYGYQWSVVFCLLILVINAYCLYFWYDVAKNRELKYRLGLMQQQNELTLQYYEEMEDNYNRSRKVIHDMRNHLHAIGEKYRIENGEYLDDLHHLLNSMGMKFYTENRMLNIVLNDKLREIPPESVDCNLGGVDFSFISEMDTTTIFANLLDNALEAAQGEHIWIIIRGEAIQDFTVVKISNPSAAAYAEGRSAKEGHEGLGLANVRQAMEKYHGEVQLEWKEGIFSVTLFFAGKGGEKE